MNTREKVSSTSVNPHRAKLRTSFAHGLFVVFDGTATSISNSIIVVQLKKAKGGSG